MFTEGTVKNKEGNRKMKKEKTDDRGFSLVELIIVVAIMAILAVVLTPQYLRYVERARNSADVQNSAEIVAALQILASDPENTEALSDGEIHITRDNPANLNGSAFAQEALQNAGLMSENGAGNLELPIRCQSMTRWDEYTIGWEIEQDGNIVFEYTSAVDGNANTEFRDAMGGQ